MTTGLVFFESDADALAVQRHIVSHGGQLNPYAASTGADE